ncbi:hypothetical protein BDR04DRAFT_1098578 [Suillus decipiens]|nr:hypothetical protein BDR04DRAFT_1098578 [Suillus decipiens]
MKGKLYPNVKLSDSLSVCRSGGITALFTSDVKPKRGTRTSSQAIQTYVEPNTTLIITDTATSSESSTQVSPPRKSRKARRRNATLTTNPESTTSLPQVTMDSQLKEMLASMQNEMGEIRGILKENESILKEIETIRKENETIRKEIEGIRKDLDAGIKHAQDVEALREVTMLLVPLHLRVLLDLARKNVLEHLGHDTWENLRASRSIYQLTDAIFNGLEQKGVSYLPSHESIYFLCSYNNIRRVNIATHSAKEDDIRHVVLTQSLESRDWKCLEGLFTYAYNGAQV